MRFPFPVCKSKCSYGKLCSCSSSMDSKGTGSALREGWTCTRSRVLQLWGLCCCFNTVVSFPLPFPALTQPALTGSCEEKEVLSREFQLLQLAFLVHSGPILLGHSHSSHCSVTNRKVLLCSHSFFKWELLFRQK